MICACKVVFTPTTPAFSPSLSCLNTPPSLTQCENRTERDRLLQFIDKLLYHRQNVKLFLDTNGVRVLVDLVTLAHLHTQRAYVPLQTSALEASPDQQKDTEKEWHYNKDKEREGPFSYGRSAAISLSLSTHSLLVHQ